MHRRSLQPSRTRRTPRRHWRFVAPGRWLDHCRRRHAAAGAGAAAAAAGFAQTLKASLPARCARPTPPITSRLDLLLCLQNTTLLLLGGAPQFTFWSAANASCAPAAGNASTNATACAPQHWLAVALRNVYEVRTLLSLGRLCLLLWRGPRLGSSAPFHSRPALSYFQVALHMSVCLRAGGWQWAASARGEPWAEWVGGRMQPRAQVLVAPARALPIPGAHRSAPCSAPRCSASSAQRSGAAVLDAAAVEWSTSDAELGQPGVPGFQGSLRLPYKQPLQPCPAFGGNATAGAPPAPAGESQDLVFQYTNEILRHNRSFCVCESSCAGATALPAACWPVPPGSRHMQRADPCP